MKLFQKKFRGGLIDSSFVLLKAPDSTAEFVYGNYIRADKDGVEKVWNKGDVHPLTYVVGGRWMRIPCMICSSSLPMKSRLQKQEALTQQSFDFRNVT
jgi:hypothetical protein